MDCAVELHLLMDVDLEGRGVHLQGWDQVHLDCHLVMRYCPHEVHDGEVDLVGSRRIVGMGWALVVGRPPIPELPIVAQRAVSAVRDGAVERYLDAYVGGDRRGSYLHLQMLQDRDGGRQVEIGPTVGVRHPKLRLVVSWGPVGMSGVLLVTVFAIAEGPIEFEGGLSEEDLRIELDVRLGVRRPSIGHGPFYPYPVFRGGIDVGIGVPAVCPGHDRDLGVHRAA